MNRSLRALSFLTLIVFLCTGSLSALAQTETDSIVTNVVFDGVNYENRTDFAWEWHKPIPESGIEWDGDPEYLASADFGIIDLASVPDTTLPFSEYVKNQIMFMGNKDGGFYEIEQMAAKYNCVIVGYLAPTENYVIESKTETSYEDLLKLKSAIAQEPMVYGDTVSLRYAFVEETSYYPNDPWNGASWDQPGGENWGVKQIGAPNAWNYRAYMHPMNIGVIDSFIDPTHPDLDAENLGNMDSISFWLDALWRDLLGKIAALTGTDPDALLGELQHGTHVSGIIGARHDNTEGISGVFPYAHIVGISTFWNRDEHSQVIDNIGSYFSNRTDFYMEMFYWLTMRSQNVHIINMSLGFEEKKKREFLALTEAEWNSVIQFYTTSCGLGRFFDALRALNYDFVFVISAGNAKLDARVNSWPLLVDNAYLKDRLIVVGAYNQELKFCDFSNYGSAVDIVAPGAQIYSTVPKSSGFTYRMMDGTSQAAPHVAGTAAMIWSMAPYRLTGPEVKSVILNNTKYTITSGYPHDTIDGQPRKYPMLNAEKAVKYVFENIGTITGHIQAEDGTPISEAIIQIENASIPARTDVNGDFTLSSPSGCISLQIFKDGFESVTRSVNVNANQITDIGTVTLSKKNVIQLGDYLTMGTYLGEPIVWRCVDIDENGPLMLSDRILCLKPFDASGKSDAYHTDDWVTNVRERYGSNCWSDSNLRQWLNSSDETVVYSHCAPTASAVFNGYNAYDGEAGFLHAFTQEELSNIKTVTQRIYINEYDSKRNGYCDGGTSELIYSPTKSNVDYSKYYYQNVTDRIFLLTPSQADAVYRNFDEYLRQAYPTQAAVKNSNYKDASLSSEKPYPYWLGIPSNLGASYEHIIVIRQSGMDYPRAYEGIYGVRPAFYLDGYTVEP